MNLASRCREAISHVAMLKKELAMHQKRASEALALQRQQNQRYARVKRARTSPKLCERASFTSYLYLVTFRASSDGSDSAVLSELTDLARPSANNAPMSTDVAVEMDRMDRIMASHAPPPPPPERVSAEVGTKEQNDRSPRRLVDDFGTNAESPASEKSSHSSSSSADANDSNGGTHETGSAAHKSPSLFPHSASPKPKHRVNYNDDYPGDVAPPHKASHEISLPAVQDEEDESSDHNPPLSHAREIANMKLSSIDAFEASFDTAFPSSFASPKEGGEPVASEIYNPFFSSPQKRGVAVSNSPLNRDIDAGDVGSPGKGRKWGNSLRDRSPIAQNSPTSRGFVDEDPNESMPKLPSTLGKQRMVEGADEDRSRFGIRSPDLEMELNSSMPDPSSSPKIVSRASNPLYSEQYRTPPQFNQKVQEPEKVTEEPRRPEKTVSASARARYEKALQPRGYHSRIKEGNTTLQVETSLDSATETRNSPGTVLRRLQQRRAKNERFQPTMDANSNPVRSNRVLHHPSIPSAESPFDEEKNGSYLERRGSGRNMTSQNVGSSYRSSQNDSENNYRRTQTNPAAKKLSPDSMNAEIRALDAMASGTYQKPSDGSPTGSDLSHNSGSSSSSSRYAALKQRRSVKQPVSYAEPPLNTKVRQGDVYFQREENPVAVSPTGSSPEDVSGARRASRARGGGGADEVLKDLKAGPATVRS